MTLTNIEYATVHSLQQRAHVTRRQHGIIAQRSRHWMQGFMQFESSDTWTIILHSQQANDKIPKQEPRLQFISPWALDPWSYGLLFQSNVGLGAKEKLLPC